MSDIKKVKRVVNVLDASDLRLVEEMKKMGVVFGRESVRVPLISLEAGAVWIGKKIEDSGFLLGCLFDTLFWYNLFKRCFREEFA